MLVEALQKLCQLAGWVIGDATEGYRESLVNHS